MGGEMRVYEGARRFKEREAPVAMMLVCNR